jgi:hypothetical protein
MLYPADRPASNRRRAKKHDASQRNGIKIGAPKPVDRPSSPPSVRPFPPTPPSTFFTQSTFSSTFSPPSHLSPSVPHSAMYSVLRLGVSHESRPPIYRALFRFHWFRTLTRPRPSGSPRPSPDPSPCRPSPGRVRTAWSGLATCPPGHA